VGVWWINGLGGCRNGWMGSGMCLYTRGWFVKQEVLVIGCQDIWTDEPEYYTDRLFFKLLLCHFQTKWNRIFRSASSMIHNYRDTPCCADYNNDYRTAARDSITVPMKNMAHLILVPVHVTPVNLSAHLWSLLDMNTVQRRHNSV
jgi:hypothetical protein